MVGRPFEKGQSGNPGGRPKGMPEVVELARQHTKAAIARLAEIMENGESERAQVAAAEIILDRGWGRAPQHVTFGDEENEPTRAGDTERLVQLARKVAAAGIGGGMDEAMPSETPAVVH